MSYHRAAKITRRALWVFLLWFIFSVGCLAAPFLALTIPFTKKLSYIQVFVRAADRLCAAMLGFSGRLLLSTELSHAPQFRWIHDALEEIDPQHCERSAYSEGAYCRLSDHKLGHR